VRRALLTLLSITMMIGISQTGCGSDSSGPESTGPIPGTLRVGLIPNIAPEQQQAKYGPFAAYLRKRLGVDVELFVAADYAGVVAALVGDRIDVAYLGGLTYVQAERQVKLTPLVTEIDQLTGTPRYDSAIVVRSDAPFQKLQGDIVSAGRSFAFGDVSSTSGSLYPRIMLSEAGAQCSVRKMDECPPLERVLFTGGHDATAQAVLSGKVDAGGIELRILRRLENDGKVPQGALRVVQQRQVQGYPWVMRDALGEPVKHALVDAFTSITDAALLDLMRARGYVAIGAPDYEEIRQHATRLGLLATS